MRRYVAFLPFVAMSFVHVTLLFIESPIAGPTKLWLMPLLALGVLSTSTGIHPWPWPAMSLVIGAIGFSWLGDGSATFFPMFDDELPMMLACFGLAHVVYVLIMWRVRGVSRGGFPLWSVIYAVAYAVLMVLLVPHTGSLTIPVMLYGLLLVATAAFASRCGKTIAWGGAWFFVSDAILAFRLFRPEIMPDWTNPAVMLTYCLGQGLLVYGIFVALRKRSLVTGLVEELQEPRRSTR
ncbi:lysoplasmalogenase [Leucobacter denitrificans]|uniref:Lysoplasmalogenase n=1 Tax=Leucobacter denitrificans TaxID=683042 RepID=A0A7G9S855_9MICO|nr:lysoplasmalogenase [Leucobacter denitrificans]